MKEVEILKLDVRGLNHPEPLERSVEMFKKLNSSNCMHLHIHRYPKPLLAIADNQGIRFDACETEEGEWHILFTKNPALDLNKMLQELNNV
ncbi:DUF2249 domain-containing protein [Hydrogenimonas thermophila]|uniref:Uncharacterized conserved protein n=1 Tax=Hydrogenimonas thermophila TaxID=223786 RepID=A0A1I5T195_9BACT|nr:DUF2249 domain-containing protein [Hydrogenimonas thermophila]WOE70683.1 DUF2249 domain-containing protein [Hydrogenimonas thermophila]WOE73201.1 DUF2249 domain-containing protein [Hydrogenimonas thermophila]SFP76417.1 Uncharacterized conserved protein [Hydrogenimonas thermophila]